MKIKIMITVLVSAIVISSCYYDREEELYGTSCDTSNVSYSTTISGIINRNGCLNCHATGVMSGGFSLEGYTNVKAKVNDGRLFGAINHSAGFVPMPQGANKMSPCDINKVKAWIDAGAPNN